MRGFIFATLLLASCAVGGDPAGDSKAGAGLGSDVDSTGSPQIGILARVCAAGATTKGVDVSYYNGKIDWTKVKAAGNEFAFIRISDGTGFHENDTPNFTFRTNHCSFYSGTKALGEEALRGFNNGYIWRLRIPFDEYDHPRNFLTKVQRYSKVHNNVNSLTHRGDFVRACLDLWERGARTGIYNVTNPGAVTTRQVVERIQQVFKTNRKFEFWKDDTEFYRFAAKTHRSNCILDVSKLLATGVKMRPVQEALKDSLERWQPTADTLRMLAGVFTEENEVSEAVGVAG